MALVGILKIAFPDLAHHQREALARKTFQHLGRCAFPRRREWDREYDVRAANASPDTHLVDFIGDICPGEVCRAVIGNALVYRDKDHLTATFARTLEPMLESDFREDGLL